eukprot:TRINITY_DN3079_c0_g1_i1.p1 TRINITY_DN3079_c0_g1~~TRINITY_DN3079_c0_g1_i1.p1  ORF type:complete len:331 (+),score=90.71 TRINITY_DN3079_c0_g1_i1:80-1072(+)
MMRHVTVLVPSSSLYGARPFSRFFATVAEKQKIGFIGLGNMGAHQASNLLKNGHDVIVLDVNQSSIDKLVSKGATSAKTPKEIAEKAKVIITMLPASQHVREVYCGKDGIFSGIQEGSVLMDSSTIDPATARQISQLASEKKSTMVDCPVSGGTGGAEAGTLTFMVGGTTEAYEKAKPYLAHMGKNIVHCGDAGTGQVAKICNNLVLGISMLGVSEAMNLGVKNGMDPKKLASIFNTSTARCWSSEIYNPCPGVVETAPAGRGYTGGFGSALMMKDLGLAVEAAKAGGEALPMGSLAHQMYQLLTVHGYGGRDFSVAYEYLQKSTLTKKE